MKAINKFSATKMLNWINKSDSNSLRNRKTLKDISRTSKTPSKKFEKASSTKIPLRICLSLLKYSSEMAQLSKLIRVIALLSPQCRPYGWKDLSSLRINLWYHSSTNSATISYRSMVNIIKSPLKLLFIRKDAGLRFRMDAFGFWSSKKHWWRLIMVWKVCSRRMLLVYLLQCQTVDL